MLKNDLVQIRNSCHYLFGSQLLFVLVQEILKTGSSLLYLEKCFREKLSGRQKIETFLSLWQINFCEWQISKVSCGQVFAKVIMWNQRPSEKLVCIHDRMNWGCFPANSCEPTQSFFYEEERNHRDRLSSLLQKIKITVLISSGVFLAFYLLITKRKWRLRNH